VLPLAAASAYESDHHALQREGQGHVVLEEGGEEEGSARSRVDRGATPPQPSILRLIRKAAALAADRPTLLFRPL